MSAFSPDQSPEPRRRFATQVRPSVQERARAAVLGVQAATGEPYSLAQLTDEALDHYLTLLEQTHNGGRPWHRRDRLPPGRRISPPP